jgi:2'-5' RNA ligase
VDEGRTALGRLAAGAAAAGRRAGAGGRPERRYHPHLTLARARDGAPRLAGFAAALAEFRVPPWPAGHLTLVRSLLPASGVPGEQPRYEALDRWPLGG